MDGTIRVRSVVWFATAVVLALVCSLLVTQAWSVGAAPGDDDSTFVPTAGCRLVDTRPAPRTVGPRNTPLTAGDIYTVTVRGSNGECTGPLAIPNDAVGVALNVTATNATARSNIRVYPADLATVPLLSNLNVTAGASPIPNKVDVKLSPDGKIKVYNFNGSVNVILDVVGYYTDSSLKELNEAVTAHRAVYFNAGSRTITNTTVNLGSMTLSNDRPCILLMNGTSDWDDDNTGSIFRMQWRVDGTSVGGNFADQDEAPTGQSNDSLSAVASTVIAPGNHTIELRGSASSGTAGVEHTGAFAQCVPFDGSGAPAVSPLADIDGEAVDDPNDPTD